MTTVTLMVAECSGEADVDADTVVYQPRCTAQLLESIPRYLPDSLLRQAELVTDIGECHSIDHSTLENTKFTVRETCSVDQMRELALCV